MNHDDHDVHDLKGFEVRGRRGVVVNSFEDLK